MSAKLKKRQPPKPKKQSAISQEVISRIPKFSLERRNSIRGIISQIHTSHLATVDIETIRSNTNESDMYLAGEILNGPKGLRKRKVRNLLQEDIPQIHRLSPLKSNLEVAYACGFVNSWKDASREATGTIKFLAQLTTVDADDAISALMLAVERWGASTYVCWKISYIKSFTRTSEHSHTKLGEIDRILRHQSAPLPQYSAMENLRETISLFAVARRHTNTLINQVNGDFRKSFTLSNLVATPFSNQDCAAFILRATESSLIDTVHAFWIVLNLAQRFPQEAAAIKRHLSPEILSELTQAMAEISSISAPSLVDYNLVQSSAETTDDVSLLAYRRSAAYLEFPQLTLFRNDIDQVVGQRLIAPLTHEPILFSGEPFNNADLLKQPNEEFSVALHGSPSVKIDTFYRTYLFLRFIQNPMNLAALNDQDIQFIFDNTIALESLMLERELKTMHINASDEARALISVLALALYRSKSSDPDVDFDFRAKLEQYIREKFGGNIKALIDDIAPNSPQVANYIAASLDEVTLQKMYTLVDSTERADEIRRDILTTIGYRLNRIEYIVEAEAIATRAKVSKIKNYFDASRMYVDSIAMRKWLGSTPSAYAEHYKELLPKIIARRSRLGTFKAPDGTEKSVDLIELSATDEHLVAEISKEAFKEFCTNSEFGIESYLGRRIRHNTLHGVMTKAVDTVIQRPEYSSVIEGTPFGRALAAWETWYKIYIERTRREILQFRSPSRPNGVFSSELNLSDVKTLNNIKQLVKALRASGPELLHDLIVAFCWQQIGPQLEAASHHIRVKMLQEVTQSLEHALIKFYGPEEQKIEAKLIESIASMFAQVGSWFQIPQTGFVPASVSDLCNIIDIEHNRTATPSFVVVDRPNIKYYGISVHRLYDCLAVLMQNAFKHGQKDSPVTVRVASSRISDTNIEQLQISVLSTMPSDRADACTSGIYAAISSTESGHDMVTEGYSGIKKVKFITKMSEGTPTVTHTIVGNEVEIRFTMRAEVVPEVSVDD